MLSHDDNALLGRVGPGTAMGDLLRQYWIPALASSEVPEPDGAPVRVRLLGEDLIGFRTTSGAVGLIQNHCPHRGASLFFGRNEAEGLRCVYHGWKFDATGSCVDMPSEPPESSFKDKVRATAYPCAERNGVVWAYMGRRATPPPLPDLEPNMLAPGEAVVQKVLRECNWFQALEGDIDTSHLGFLHLGAVDPKNTKPGTFDYYLVAERAARFDAVDTEFGTSYGCYRPAEADTYYWRIAHYLFPFYTMIPTGVLGMQVLVRAWVPVDDEHVMFWSMGVPRSREGRGSAGGANGMTAGGRPVAAAGNSDGGFEFLPETTDWLGRFRLAQHKDNDYLIDRRAQKEKRAYSGVFGIAMQDASLQESMGPIQDHAKEKLLPTDRAIVMARRMLYEAAIAMQDGATPPALDADAQRVRAAGVLLDRNVKPQEWAKTHLTGGLEQPVYSI